MVGAIHTDGRHKGLHEGSISVGGSGHRRAFGGGVSLRMLWKRLPEEERS